MIDLVEREDVIEAIEAETWLGIVECHVDVLMDRIEAIPSKGWQKWIPCSERLPNEQGQYLVTFPLCNGEPWVYILSFSKGKFYETDDEWGDVEYDDVTAWMPLPEPWKGAGDE